MEISGSTGDLFVLLLYIIQYYLMPIIQILNFYDSFINLVVFTFLLNFNISMQLYSCFVLSLINVVLLPKLISVSCQENFFFSIIICIPILFNFYCNY